MIIVLRPDLQPLESTLHSIEAIATTYEGVDVRTYNFEGSRHRFTEVHLLGQTAKVPVDPFNLLPGVLKVFRVSTRYRLIGRHASDHGPVGFTYNGVTFDESEVHVFAGLCAVDTREHVDQMFAACEASGLTTTRMGAYKPRTSPYDFQGLGASCLPWVFESAGNHGVRIVSMEVTDARQIDEIRQALAVSGQATGVMLQVGTRNAQNFELLKAIGQQHEFPVLFKRGMGITLEESLNACEYIASEGNSDILFCLRGVKSHLGDPHRNLVDFAHVPVVRRQTRLPVCIDPSHSVGRMATAPDGLPDIFHATGQGIVAGATSVLIDYHPHPEAALCDGPQALLNEDLPAFLNYVNIMRKAYLLAVEAACAESV
ncbi:MAG: 3-deoxy-7-phosphoheptulonate synthase [Candidatus Paceibacteria bacterium]|jgi:3-deoxy-7-phosphoheptulonate synthase